MEECPACGGRTIVGTTSSSRWLASVKSRSAKTYWPGSGIYALLDVGVQVADKGLLVSAGDGTLTPFVAATGGVVVAQANEAVNNVAGLEPARVQVETVVAYYVAPTP